MTRPPLCFKCRASEREHGTRYCAACLWEVYGDDWRAKIDQPPPCDSQKAS